MIATCVVKIHCVPMCAPGTRSIFSKGMTLSALYVQFPFHGKEKIASSKRDLSRTHKNPNLSDPVLFLCGVYLGDRDGLPYRHC